MARELVATLLIDVTEARRLPNRRRPTFHKETRVYHVHLEDGFLTCMCPVAKGVRFPYEADAIAPTSGCAHIFESLYQGIRTEWIKVNLTKLGHEMFDWRYAVRSL